MPGERISANIEEGLDWANIVILVWSRHAAASQWVGQEIEYALKAKTVLLPYLLDDTPLPKNLKNTLGISFYDYNQEFGRLNLALFKQGAAEFGLDIDALTGELDDWDGVINIINDYRRQEKVSGDAAYWINQVLDATHIAHTAGSAFMEQYEGSVDFIQSLTARLDAAKDDRERLQEILYEVIHHENLAPPIMQKMRIMIEQMIDQLPARPRRNSDWQSSEAELNSIRSIRGTLSGEAPSDPRAQLRRHLQGNVPAHELNEIIEYLVYYN